MQMQYGSKGSSSNWRLGRQRRWRNFDLRIESILEASSFQKNVCSV